MSETLSTQPQEQHELDKQIAKAKNKLGQKVLDKLFNFKDAGRLTSTKEVAHLSAVKGADEANEQLRKEYTDAHVGEQKTVKRAEAERQILDQIEEDRADKLGLTRVDLDSIAFKDITEWRNDETDREFAAIARTEDAKADAHEFYGKNKDNLHEAALYDAKTAGVDIKTPENS